MKESHEYFSRGRITLMNLLKRFPRGVFWGYSPKYLLKETFLNHLPKVFTQRNFPKSFTQSVYSIEFSWSIYAKCSLEGVYPMALHGWITRVNYTNTTSLVRWILECFPQDEYKNLSPSAFPKVNTWKRKVLRNKLNKSNVMTIGNWDIP